MRTPLILTVAGLIALTFASISRAAPKPTTAPSDTLIADAKKAIEANKLGDFAMQVEVPLRESLADLKNIDTAHLTRLAALREFGSYFPKVAAADDRNAKLLLWLLDQPDLLNTLMMAVNEKQDDTERVMTVLRSLQSVEAKRLEEFPDLTSAICVVWDTPGSSSRDDRPVADVDRPQWIFRYFANSRGKTRI